MTEVYTPSWRREASAWAVLLALVSIFAAAHGAAWNAKQLQKEWMGLGVLEVDVLALATLYAAFVVVIRWQMIAWPIHNQLQARLTSLRDQLPGVKQPELHAPLLGLIEHATALSRDISVLDVIFWSRGRETAGWQLIDEAEQLMVRAWPDERVVARVPSLIHELEGLGTPPARQIAVELKAWLPSSARPVAGLPVLRELIVQGMIQQRAVLRQHDMDIDYYNNKLMWYIVIALMAIVLVTNFLPDILAHTGVLLENQQLAATLVLGGAVGGVLSRLTRAVRSDYTMQELGLQWMALFLSPLLGAIAGWAGVLLVELLQTVGLLTLGRGWHNDTVFLGLALMFGLSERLFGDLAGRAEAQVGAALKNGTAGGAAKADDKAAH